MFPFGKLRIKPLTTYIRITRHGGALWAMAQIPRASGQAFDNELAQRRNQEDYSPRGALWAMAQIPRASGQAFDRELAQRRNQED